MKKTRQFLWALLPMAVALIFASCSSDSDVTEVPAPPQPTVVKNIPYTVTVASGATRSTVDNDNMTLRFATGDKLYITGTNIKGTLNIQSGMGETSGATFSGDLTYTGEGTPAANLSLTATLVSAQQTVGTQISVNDAGAVTVNYPTTAYCSSVNDAVQQYSRLTGTSTYGDKAFTLTQQTAFLNFVITFEDNTNADTQLSAVVSNNSSAVCTANVTTTIESEKVVAKFVLPVASGTTLTSATVKMGDKEALTITDATLDGKVYNVRKTQAAPAYTMAANATAGDVGKLICTDGHIHTYNADAACTKSRVAMIAYVGSEAGVAGYTHGLALALTDESSSGMYWNDAKTACTNKNTSATVESASWMLPSKDQWNKMIDACKNVLGDNDDSRDLRDGFTSVGGSNLESQDYWSSTEYVYPNEAWMFNFGYDCWYDYPKAEAYPQVRACLAF